MSLKEDVSRNWVNVKLPPVSFEMSSSGSPVEDQTLSKSDNSASTELSYFKRSTKNLTEKRKRNREYARKFANKAGGSRRKQVVEEKRLVVAKSEDVFQAEVFKMTTDDDMPAYSGFDFLN